MLNPARPTPSQGRIILPFQVQHRWPCRLFLNAKRTTQIGTLTKLVRFEDTARDGILNRDAQG